jgi:HEAT repeat protein
VRVLIEKLGIGTRENSMLSSGLFRDIAVDRPDEIRELLEDEVTEAAVKAAAIDALSARGDYSLVPLISKLVLKAGPAARTAALPARARRLRPSAAARAVEHGLDSEAWWVRSAAAQAAGRIGLTRSVDRLVALLDDPQWWVRFRAAEALVAVGEEGRLLLREVAAGGTELAAAAARLTLAEQGLAPMMTEWQPLAIGIASWDRSYRHRHRAFADVVLHRQLVFAGVALALRPPIARASCCGGATPTMRRRSPCSRLPSTRK